MLLHNNSYEKRKRELSVDYRKKKGSINVKVLIKSLIQIREYLGAL